jgi:hypothetical protein
VRRTGDPDLADDALIDDEPVGAPPVTPRVRKIDAPKKAAELAVDDPAVDDPEVDDPDEEDAT